MGELNFNRKRGLRRLSSRGSGFGRGPRLGGGKRRVRFERRSQGISFRSVVVWVLEILLVCAVAVFLVASFGKKVSNAGESMSPTIQNGDVALVNRLAYKLKGPDRGDVIAFRPGGDENVHFSILRVVALPGETVQILDQEVHINGKKQESHVFVSQIDDPGNAAEPVELGKDEYFVLGDNGASDGDSRFDVTGIVKKEDIYGGVWYVLSDSGKNHLVKN